MTDVEEERVKRVWDWEGGGGVPRTGIRDYRPPVF